MRLSLSLMLLALSQFSMGSTLNDIYSVNSKHYLEDKEKIYDELKRSHNLQILEDIGGAQLYSWEKHGYYLSQLVCVERNASSCDKVSQLTVSSWSDKKNFKHREVKIFPITIQVTEAEERLLVLARERQYDEKFKRKNYFYNLTTSTLLTGATSNNPFILVLAIPAFMIDTISIPAVLVYREIDKAKIKKEIKNIKLSPQTQENIKFLTDESNAGKIKESKEAIGLYFDINVEMMKSLFEYNDRYFTDVDQYIQYRNGLR